MTAIHYEPVRQSVEVPVEQAKAFDVFTRETGSWWPLRSHSIAGDKALDAFFELHPGGRIYEVDAEGSQHEWGRVIECDPPKRILFSWHPGHPESEATEVEIVFHDLGDSTKVELEHRNWEKLGENAAKFRKSYALGWPRVLELFADKGRGLDS